MFIQAPASRLQGNALYHNGLKLSQSLVLSVAGGDAEAEELFEQSPAGRAPLIAERIVARVLERGRRAGRTAE
jgi:ribonucleoside-diphosphate reductase alpha chain